MSFEIHICNAQREDETDPPINTTLPAIIPSTGPYSKIKVVSTLERAFNLDTNMNSMFLGQGRRDGRKGLCRKVQRHHFLVELFRQGVEIGFGSLSTMQAACSSAQTVSVSPYSETRELTEDRQNWRPRGKLLDTN